MKNNRIIYTNGQLATELAHFVLSIKKREITDNKKCERRLMYLIAKIQRNERRKYDLE